MTATFLIIEDNSNNLELMACLLKAYGHNVETACDGKEGLARALCTTYDSILCDLGMPKMTGYEFVQELRIRRGERHPPIVAITAYAMVGDREKVLEAGFDGYLSKPISIESFVQQVEVFLPSEKRSAKVLPSHEADPVPVSAAGLNRGNILVVDDSPLNLILMRSVLEPSGYNVVTLESVSQAMEEVKRTSFDLIISDLHMPIHTGLEFLQMVKADALLRSIPFILFSASAPSLNGQEQQFANSLGAEKILGKPLDPEQLLFEVESLFDRKGVKDGNHPRGR